MYICHHIQLKNLPLPPPMSVSLIRIPVGVLVEATPPEASSPPSQTDTPGALEWLPTDTLPHRSERRPTPPLDQHKI